jgi:hypothetical protein
MSDKETEAFARAYLSRQAQASERERRRQLEAQIYSRRVIDHVGEERSEQRKLKAPRPPI